VYDGQHDQAAGDANSRPDTELALAHLDSLPTLSAVAVRVLQVTSDQHSSAADVIRLVRGDQALTTRLLSLAASAWTGVREPVTTLEKAVPLLGFSALRSIVLSVSVFEAFPASRAERADIQFDRREFWKHALAVACAAQRLASQHKDMGIDPHDAFVAGLLHDIGKAALSAVFPKSYDRISVQANQSRSDIADIERAVLGLDHTVAGRHVAERWRLPRDLQEVIWLHHLAGETLPASVSNPGLIALVRLADALAREQRLGYSGNHVFYEPSPQLAARCGIGDRALEAVAGHLIADVSAHAELLGLDQETPAALYAQATARANVELGRLNTELSVRSQRLAAGARYFRAISLLDQQLTAWTDPAGLVTAMTRASALALQRSRVAVFGSRDRSAAVDVCWIDEETGRGTSFSESVTPELAAWLKDPGDAQHTVVARTPAPIRTLLHEACTAWGDGPTWLVPIVHDGKLTAGIVYWSPSDERVRLSGEQEDLRCFLSSLGLALGRAHAQAAARQLSDDLADANRRLQQMQAEVLRSRTLAMIAEMAAGAGHELNSPLTVISGRAQMLAQTLDTPDVRRALELVQAKAHECSQIVSELMDFARPRAPTFAPVDLGALLAQVRDEWLAQHALPASKIQLDVPGLSPSPAPSLLIEADAEQLKLLFRELLANATDATAERGTITLACRPADPSASEVIVRDTGIGMPPHVLQRAFDPFFSYRRAGRRRGLGLSRAYRIAESHGGRIWLESVPDEGTTAHVRLPRSAPRSLTASSV